ncbi:hypothetical protein BO85DRAFT_432276 [Aspergillus piperis CBS 112811]|uniref:Uncharacterized protein n=1 Tax=Aspergillus piperis CBS 112811 TaxID=1448313 RepID=A0A8G1VIV5_9EURO|nr:hypothetical protein BO85DRAFT_432276 [Aspergillus piperis CBS 112811]RAH52103.1 hypothetical protein BO85DRAFT_432276 [Aspergillus piperis CBS 112811]
MYAQSEKLPIHGQDRMHPQTRYDPPNHPPPQYDQAQYVQPQYGPPPTGQPHYGQSQYGQPQYGQPQYGQPHYGQQQYTQPQYGQTQYGQPQYGQPQYGQTPYGQLQPGPNPVFGGQPTPDPRYDSQAGMATMGGPLPLPVVIPQQRPGSQERGFMAAYAPSLESCGIDQRSFLRFIDETNTALEGNKYLAGVQVVSLGVGFTPEVIVMGVAAAVQAGAWVANKGYVRGKTNNVMDKYNRELFAPNGLFCMIMKHDPELKEPKNSSRLKQLASMAVNGSSNGGGSAWMRNHISGSTQGPSGLPTAVAPLVYMDNRRQHKNYLSDSPPSDSPAPERDVVPPAGGKVSTKEKAKKAFDNFNDYLDRRARAKYMAENGSDALSGPAGRGFSNRYLDPNHPAVNGGLIGVLSGGVLSPTPEQRAQKKAARIDEEERRVLDEYNDRKERILNDRRSQSETDRELRRLDKDYEPRLEVFRKKRRELEGGKRSIKSNILYLMIVNLPSDATLAAASSKLDQEYGHSVTTETMPPPAY